MAMITEQRETTDTRTVIIWTSLLTGNTAQLLWDTSTVATIFVVQHLQTQRQWVLGTEKGILESASMLWRRRWYGKVYLFVRGMCSGNHWIYSRDPDSLLHLPEGPFWSGVVKIRLQFELVLVCWKGFVYRRKQRRLRKAIFLRFLPTLPAVLIDLILA